MLALAACAEAPTKGASPAPAALSLQDYLKQASKAAAEGAPEKAREAYRGAAKAYPANKEPWARLSEDYFVAGDYGNAIVSAQEVLLRDASDTAATSVLAVSGLRVSASALQTLRVQNRIAGETRSEAETMARVLRTVLVEDASASRQPNPASSQKSRPPRPSRPGPASASAKAPDAPAPGAAPAVGNPFDRIK